MMRLRRCVLLTVAVVTWMAAPARAQWMIAPYLGANVSGDVEQGKGGPGGSAGYLGRRFGFEFDVMRYQHFFKDSEVFPLDPAAPPNCTSAVREAGDPCTDIDTDAIGFMGNVVLPLRVQGAPKWRPYGTVGLGVIRAWTNEQGRHQNNLGFNGGGGLMYSVSQHVGLRGDLRYFRVFVDENTREGVLPRDYGFLRVSFGITVEFPH
jgi:opacity protein-like surface antigen